MIGIEELANKRGRIIHRFSWSIRNFCFFSHDHLMLYCLLQKYQTSYFWISKASHDVLFCPWSQPHKCYLWWDSSLCYSIHNVIFQISPLAGVKPLTSDYHCSVKLLITMKQNNLSFFTHYKQTTLHITALNECWSPLSFSIHDVWIFQVSMHGKLARSAMYGSSWRL